MTCEHDESRFRILSGLPAYGPMPEQFSDTGQGTHREGLAIEFRPSSDSTWVGNFQPGFTDFHAALAHPDGHHVVVIAGGTAYIIDPITRRCVESFGADFSEILLPDSHPLLVLSSGIDLLALDATGNAWRTGRISIDGIRSLRFEGGKILGEGWWGSDDENWSTFEVSIETGEVTGTCWENWR